MYQNTKYILPILPVKQEYLTITARGQITFSRDAALLLGLGEKPNFAIIYLSENPEYMYVSVREDSDNMGYRLKRKDRRYVCNNASLARGILTQLKIEGNAIFRLGSAEYLNDEKVYPIITKINLYERKANH